MSVETSDFGISYALGLWVASVDFDGVAVYGRYAHRASIGDPGDDEGHLVGPDKPPPFWSNGDIIMAGSITYQIAMPVTPVDGSGL